MYFQCFLRLKRDDIIESATKMADIEGKRAISWKERCNLILYEM